VNKQERTYTVLRDRIHSGAFGPQARLNIDALARELGVSAIPVREALRRLEAEGWVKFQPNVGAIVAPLDATAWEQQMVAVAILEGAATAEAAPYLRPADFAKVRKLAAEMEQIAAEGDIGLSWRHPELDASLELSTKVLEFGQLGLPVILNRTPMHEDLLGADYPLFAASLDDVADVAALAGLRLGEIVCIPGLNNPSMIDNVSQVQQALLLTAVSSPLASRYQPA